MYGPCEKCGPGDPLSAGIPMTLAGGYRTKLCDRHANEWSELVGDSIESRDLDEADVGVGCYISQGNFDNAMSYQCAKRKIEREFYDIAKAWCQEPEAVPQPQWPIEQLQADIIEAPLNVGHEETPRLAVLEYDQAIEELQTRVDALDGGYEDPASPDAEPEHGDRREGL